MCVICGCSDHSSPSLHDPKTGENHAITEPHDHSHEHGHEHSHDHSHDHGHEHTHERKHPPRTKMIELEQNILAKNDRFAAENRRWLYEREVFALNLIGGPGAGKTALLERTAKDFKHAKLMVIEGDQETSYDAERLAAVGCPAVQINTGAGCHLDALMTKEGLTSLNPLRGSLVVIENVGNLVCPSLFDLGEHLKVVMLSVTEGEDKPLKYPHAFRAAKVVLLTKIDLMPYLSFDMERCLGFIKKVNPQMKVFLLSSKSGEGFSAWYEWLSLQLASVPLDPASVPLDPASVPLDPVV
jgi:hydrogenase nickel incorporation protein HypB